LSSASTDFDKTDNDFSLGGWVKLTSKITNQGIITKYNATGNQRSYALQHDGFSSFKFTTSSDGTSFGADLTDESAPSIGTWYFVVCVHDSVNDLIKISVNDSTFKTTALSGGVFNTSEDFAIGRRANKYFNGQVDGAFFYDKALTQDQVSALYNSGNGRFNRRRFNKFSLLVGFKPNRRRNNVRFSWD
jgi:hypothetical protein